MDITKLINSPDIIYYISVSSELSIEEIYKMSQQLNNDPEIKCKFIITRGAVYKLHERFK